MTGYRLKIRGITLRILLKKKWSANAFASTEDAKKEVTSYFNSTLTQLQLN